jgi:acetyltransferase-like isoleucine patch superfamily enzyme
MFIICLINLKYTLGMMFLMTNINADKIDIHPTVEIGKNVVIDCENVKIGKFCKIGDNVTITCRSFEVDSWLFMWHGVEIGRGGCNGPNSNVRIGSGVGIFENVVINSSESVEIGDNCGIGADVMIWTHGAWLDITQGFPSDFGPVKIGNNVWLPARSIVLPNVTVGDNVVIGTNSLVNKDLPSGCLAAGSPCKVLKENVYPKKLSEDVIKVMVEGILSDWKIQCDMKKIARTIKVRYENQKIYLYQSNFETIYNIEERTIDGHINNVSEDLRDYLRRRGIKIYTDRFFKSI